MVAEVGMACMVLDSIGLVVADMVAAQSLVVVVDHTIVEIVHSLLVVVAAYVFPSMTAL